MSFVDTSSSVPYLTGNVGGSAQLGGSGGAPYGGAADVNSQVSLGTPPGMHGPGGSGQITHWVIGFYIFIAAVLISAGVIFNGKGR